MLFFLVLMMCQVMIELLIHFLQKHTHNSIKQDLVIYNFQFRYHLFIRYIQQTKDMHFYEHILLRLNLRFNNTLFILYIYQFHMFLEVLWNLEYLLHYLIQRLWFIHWESIYSLLFELVEFIRLVIAYIDNRVRTFLFIFIFLYMNRYNQV